MKATGIVRRIDDLGRGVIPKESEGHFVFVKVTFCIQHWHISTNFPLGYIVLWTGTKHKNPSEIPLLYQYWCTAFFQIWFKYKKLHKKYWHLKNFAIKWRWRL